METEDRIKALEDEFMATRKEISQILMDIRAFLMETHTPLQGSRDRGSQPDSPKGGR